MENSLDEPSEQQASSSSANSVSSARVLKQQAQSPEIPLASATSDADEQHEAQVVQAGPSNVSRPPALVNRPQSSIELSTVSEASESEQLNGNSTACDSNTSASVSSVQQAFPECQTDDALSARGTLINERPTPERDLERSESAALNGPAGETSAAVQRHEEHAAQLTRSRSIEQQQASPLRSRSSSTGVDCPYVRDIKPLAGEPGAVPHGLAGAKRLSHDDTMEAIEDDVEGEEQEMRLLAEQPPPLAPPAGFSTDDQQTPPFSPSPAGTPTAAAEFHRRPLSRTSDSIKEEDEEFEAADDDDESSISVCQQHGLVVRHEIVGGKRHARNHDSEPPSPSSDHSEPSAGSQPSSDTKTAVSSASSPAMSTSSRSGSQRQPLVGDDELASETLARLEQSKSGRAADSAAAAASPEDALVDLREDNVQAEDSEPQPGERPTSGAPDELKQSSPSQEQPVRHSSGDSATQAILDHLSRHHPGSSSLGEEPAPSLESSRSIDPQIRRDGWRRESANGRREEREAHEAQPDSPELEASSSRTGTMKRRRRSVEPPSQGAKVAVEPEGQPQAEVSEAGRVAESEQADREQHAPEQSARRRPPLKQLKSDQQLQAGRGESKSAEHRRSQAQASSSIDRTDTSICSSCSCMESSFDAQQAHKRAPGSWMSQEEGTVFTENYWLAHWLYISEHEEAEIWRRAIDMTGASSGATTSGVVEGDNGNSGGASDAMSSSVAGMPVQMSETSSTSSEKGFSSRYKSTTRKMIHRRATIEMYKRVMNNNLKREKRVEISRSNGEFGFRIHGSRPVVVSAIERGTSAETCGLQVGDLIYAINGTNILDMAHSEVVRLAHSADTNQALVLDLIPTNDFLRMSKYNRSNNRRYEPTVTGFLMRLSPSTAQPLLIELQRQLSRSGSQSVGAASTQQRAAKLNEVMRLAWRRRYFVLRGDNCLYWYKSPQDIEPHGGINLQGFSATLTDEFSEPNYVIRLVKYASQPHYLGSNNMCDVKTWVDAINRAATEANQNDPYMKRTLVLARGKPNQIQEPDCCGWLYKFSHKRAGGAHWRAAYFVLKDACLYLFRDQQPEMVHQASAVYYLHGYRVRSKHIEHKKHTFELIPPNRKTIKPIFLMASNEIDKKRWIAALEYSIDRWIEID